MAFDLRSLDFSFKDQEDIDPYYNKIYKRDYFPSASSAENARKTTKLSEKNIEAKRKPHLITEYFSWHTSFARSTPKSFQSNTRASRMDFATAKQSHRLR